MIKWDAYRVYLLYSLLGAIFYAMMSTYNIVYQVTVIGLNPLQLVLVGTVLELVVFVAEVPTGVVADAYSRRLSIIIGTFLIGLGFTLEGAIPRLEAVLLAQVIWGIGATFTSGATSAWIADEVGENRVGPAFMRGAQLGQLGGILGVIAGTALATLAVNVPVIAGGLLHIGLAGLLVLIMPETGFTPTSRADRNTFQHMAHTFREGTRAVRGRPVLIGLLVVAIFWGMASEGFDRLWQKHLLDNFTLPTIDGLDPVTWFGIISVLGSVAAAAATEAVRRTVDTTRPSRLSRSLAVIDGLRIVLVLAFALAGQFTVALLALLVAETLRAIRWPLYDTWLNQQIDSKARATVLSMSAQLDAAGQIAGGPVVGWIGLRLTVRAAIFTAGLLLSPVLFLYERARRRDAALSREARQPDDSALPVAPEPQTAIVAPAQLADE